MSVRIAARKLVRNGKGDIIVEVWRRHQHELGSRYFISIENDDHFHPMSVWVGRWLARSLEWAAVTIEDRKERRREARDDRALAL